MRRSLINERSYFLKNYYLNRGFYLREKKMFGENNLGKRTMYIVIKVKLRRFYPAFLFSLVLIQRH